LVITATPLSNSYSLPKKQKQLICP